MARFRQDLKVEALRKSPLFAGLSGRQLTQVARLTDDLEVPPGSVLCKEGAKGREFFVIIEGRAAVTRDDAEVATIGPGDFFGEVSLLEPVRRTATVTALTPLRFFLVSDTAFHGLLATDPEIERKLLRTLVHRLVSSSVDPRPG